MPRKSRHEEPPDNIRETTTIVKEPIPELEEGAAGEFDPSMIDPNLPVPQPEEITALLSELGNEDHRVIVYRFNKSLNKFARLDSYGHKEFTLDTLSDMYGGGKYRIFVSGPGGRVVFSKVIDIDEAKRPKADHVNLPGNGGVYQPPASDSKLMEIVMAQSSKNQELMMTMMTKLAESIGSANNRPQPPSFIKDVQDMAALQKMLDGGNKPDPQINNMNAVLNALQKGIELAQAAGGGASAGDSEGGTMGTILKMILPALTGGGLKETIADALRPAMIPQRPPAPAPQPLPDSRQLPAPGPQPLPVASNPQREEPMSFSKPLIRMMYKDALLEMAKSNFEPDKAAEMILLRIPEQYHPVCLDFTSKPPAERMELVAEFFPELKEGYADWTNKVLDCGRSILTEIFSTPAGTSQPEPTEKKPENANA